MAFARCTTGAFKACQAPKLRVRRVAQNVARCAAKAENAEKASKPAAAEKKDESAKAESPFPAREPAAAQSSASSSQSRKAGPLQRGGTLTGEKAAGKDAGSAAKSGPPGAKSGAKSGGAQRMQIVDGYFRDDRWVDGTWDFAQFAGAGGETDWNAVIDAEMGRRKLLEDTPIPSRNDDPVNFDTNMVPWWAWVKRFHLPEAEKLNGRAAMMGYLLAGVVDLASGAGLVEQQESFFGKLLLHLVVFGILLIRSTDDIAKYKNLFDEATFYDKQWNATWEGQVRPSEQEKSS